MVRKKETSSGDDSEQAGEHKTDSVDLEALLAKKEELDQLIKRKFTRVVTGITFWAIR